MSSRLCAVLLILLSVSVPSFAQGTDISLEVFGDSMSARLTTTYFLKVSWKASTPVRNVALEADFPGDVRFLEAGMQCAGARSIRCTLPSVAEHFADVSVVVTFPGPGTYTSTARVTSDTPDPNPANNAATVSTFVSGLPSLRVHAIAEIAEEGFALDPGGVGRLRIAVDNDGEKRRERDFRRCAGRSQRLSAAGR